MSSQNDSGNTVTRTGSDFDFKRWNLDNLNLDPKAATLAPGCAT